MVALRLTKPATAKIALICFILAFAAASLLFQTGRASAHGYVDGPASRAALCKSGANKNCGSIVYEPQSLEAPKGFPAAGPADGQIASANGKFTELDEQSAARWSKVNMNSGSNTFTWTITAAHSTTSWKYYITKQDWDPNAPLSRSSFDLTPFCTVSYNGAQPTSGHTDTCSVPARTGYQVILAVWEIADTGNAFYSVIDANFSGTSTADATAPTAPASLKGTAAATSVALSWAASTDNVGVTGYNVYNGSKLVATLTGTNYTVTGLTANTAYVFTVKAIDNAGNLSGASNSLNVTTTAPPATDTTAPTAPSGLHFMGTPTTSSMMLMWTASTDNVGVTGYKIYNGSALVATTAGTADSYTVTGLAAGKTYAFTVYAIDAAGNQSAASTISGATAAAPPATDTTAPSAPAGLHIMGTPTTTSMMLMWTASTDNVGIAGYKIYNGSTLVTTTAGTAASYTVTGLAAGKTYAFTVYAIDAAGNQSAASTVSGTTAAASTTAAPWATNTAYKRGDLVTYNGHTYKCLQSHISIYTWTPTAAVSLWELQK